MASRTVSRRRLDDVFWSTCESTALCTSLFGDRWPYSYARIPHMMHEREITLVTSSCGDKREGAREGQRRRETRREYHPPITPTTKRSRLWRVGIARRPYMVVTDPTKCPVFPVSAHIFIRKGCDFTPHRCTQGNDGDCSPPPCVWSVTKRIASGFDVVLVMALYPKLFALNAWRILYVRYFTPNSLPARENHIYAELP